MTKVLVVDDEKLIVKGIRFSLEQDNMEVDCAYDGEEAMSKAKEKEYDVILLDVMLPKADGFEVLQTVREFSEDDYITKPFNILEVKARIKAILRRNSMRNRKSEEPKKQVIVAGSLKLDRDGRRVFVNEKEINLTAKEFDLLELLVCNPNKVYSREALLAYVWGNKAMDSGDVRTVDVHVRRLREKIEPSPSAPQFVHTKWGVGYYFAAK